MISIEVEAKNLITEMARQADAATIIRKYDGQIRVEVANGSRACAWSFTPLVRSKAAALRDVQSDMQTALRRVGLSARPTPLEHDIADQARQMPPRLNGPIGDKIREAIVRRVGKPVETEQPEASFPVAIPERKAERKELRLLKQRVAEIEREMASVKQITDQLR